MSVFQSPLVDTQSHWFPAKRSLSESSIRVHLHRTIPVFEDVAALSSFMG
jgi:hypothetical protein